MSDTPLIERLEQALKPLMPFESLRSDPKLGCGVNLVFPDNKQNVWHVFVDPTTPRGVEVSVMSNWRPRVHHKWAFSSIKLALSELRYILARERSLWRQK